MEKVKCNNCTNTNVTGTRYICCECPNFILCQKCKEKSNIVHNKDHAFVQINKPIKIDIKKFNNFFRPNKFLFNNSREPFDINFEILNKGENNLKGCYITSIKASKKYLRCVKKVINEDVKNNEKIRMKLTIVFNEEDDDDSTQDVYEGYYRLFSAEGVPFGDILYIQVITDD